MAARAVLLFCNIFLILNGSTALGGMSKKLYPPMKEDIPFIECDVCQKGVKYLYRKAKVMREESATKKIEEEKLQELVEKACNPKKFEGEWIAMLDIEEENGGLKVTEHEDLGSCKAECQTIAKACQDTVGEADTDIAEELWKDDLSLSKLINQVCYSETKACGKNRGKFKSNSRKDEMFEVMSEDEKKAQEYLKKAGDVPGMPNMEMYSREEMEEMVKKESGQASSNDKHSGDASDTSDNSQSFGGGIIWQTIVQVLDDIWEWIRSIFGYGRRTTEDL